MNLVLKFHIPNYHSNSRTSPLKKFLGKAFLISPVIISRVKDSEEAREGKKEQQHQLEEEKQSRSHQTNMSCYHVLDIKHLEELVFFHVRTL